MGKGSEDSSQNIQMPNKHILLTSWNANQNHSKIPLNFHENGNEVIKKSDDKC